MSRPNGLIANKGLELLTCGTPNGHKVTILLEELKEAYGKPDYVFQNINIKEKIQKESWYTKLNPSGKVPVLIDHDRNGLAIMEGSAILSYLTRHFDPEHKFTFTEDPDLSVCEQWASWQHGELGPMQNQANQFFRFNPTRYSFPTQKFVGEVERLYGVLDARLRSHEFLAGNKYSIADIASFSWVNFSALAGVDLEKFPNLQRWWQQIKARPAVVKGTAVPSESPIVNEAFAKRLGEEEEFAKTNEELHSHLEKARGEFGYTYQSP